MKYETYGMYLCMVEGRNFLMSKCLKYERKENGTVFITIETQVFKYETQVFRELMIS